METGFRRASRAARRGVVLAPPSSQQPEGDQPLTHVANPLSLIVEQAGGVATTGEENILGITPAQPDHRIAAVLGSRDNIGDLLCCLNE